MLRAPPRALSPRSGDSVEVFSSGPPSRAHVDLALIEATQQSSSSDGGTAELVAQMRSKAGELGCDALVISDAVSRADSLNNLLTGQNTDRKGLVGTCVVYSDEQPYASTPATIPISQR